VNAGFLMLLDGIGEGWLDTTAKKRKFQMFFFRENGRVRTNTYSLSSTRVNPAEPIRYSLSLFNFIAKVGIVLVDVEGEQRRIDRRICVQSLEQTLLCIKKI
jgi:hypothetical protein